MASLTDLLAAAQRCSPHTQRDFDATPPMPLFSLDAPHWRCAAHPPDATSPCPSSAAAPALYRPNVGKCRPTLSVLLLQTSYLVHHVHGRRRRGGCACRAPFLPFHVTLRMPPGLAAELADPAPGCRHPAAEGAGWAQGAGCTPGTCLVLPYRPTASSGGVSSVTGVKVGVGMSVGETAQTRAVHSLVEVGGHRRGLGRCTRCAITASPTARLCAGSC